MKQFTKGEKFKLACVAIYATIVGGVTVAVYLHASTATHTVATRAIKKGERIVDADLRPIDQAEISGRYAKRDFGVGERIKPQDVSRTPTLARVAEVAAVVSMPILSGLAITSGSKAQLCLDKKPHGKEVQPLAATCDNNICVVTIPIKEWPKDLAANDVERRLSVVPAGDQCVP